MHAQLHVNRGLHMGEIVPRRNGHIKYEERNSGGKAFSTSVPDGCKL